MNIDLNRDVQIRAVLTEFDREIQPIIAIAGGNAMPVYYGTIRVLAMLAALPSEMWPGAAPPAERLEVQQRCFREVAGGKGVDLAGARADVLPPISAQVSAELMEASTTLVWDVVDRILGEHSTADAIIALQVVLVAAAKMRGDPAGTCAWILEEHRRQFDLASSAGFRWPDLSLFLDAISPSEPVQS